MECYAYASCYYLRFPLEEVLIGHISTSPFCKIYPSKIIHPKIQSTPQHRPHPSQRTTPPQPLNTILLHNPSHHLHRTLPRLPPLFVSPSIQHHPRLHHINRRRKHRPKRPHRPPPRLPPLSVSPSTQHPPRLHHINRRRKPRRKRPRRPRPPRRHNRML